MYVFDVWFALQINNLESEDPKSERALNMLSYGTAGLIEENKHLSFQSL